MADSKRRRDDPGERSRHDDGYRERERDRDRDRDKDRDRRDPGRADARPRERRRSPDRRDRDRDRERDRDKDGAGRNGEARPKGSSRDDEAKPRRDDHGRRRSASPGGRKRRGSRGPRREREGKRRKTSRSRDSSEAVGESSTGSDSGSDGPARQRGAKKAKEAVPIAVQKQVDQLDAKMDAVATVCGLYLAIPAVEEACNSKEFPSSLRQSLYHTTLLKATSIFAAALVDRVLFFILKYLTTHKLKEIDVITWKFLDRLRGAQLSERATKLLPMIKADRSCKHTESLFTAKADKAQVEAAREGQKQLKEFDGASLSLPKTSKLTLPEEVDAFVEAITSRRQLSINMARERVKRAHQLAGTLVQQAAARDPGSNELLQTPCIGSECRHIQAFELKPFLASVLALRRRGKKSAWRCPICRRVVSEDSLVHCRLTTDILQQLPPDHEGYEVYYDGSWAPVKKVVVPAAPSGTTSPAGHQAIAASDEPASKEATPGAPAAPSPPEAATAEVAPVRETPASEVPATLLQTPADAPPPQDPPVDEIDEALEEALEQALRHTAAPGPAEAEAAPSSPPLGEVDAPGPDPGAEEGLPLLGSPAPEVPTGPGPEATGVPVPCDPAALNTHPAPPQ